MSSVVDIVQKRGAVTHTIDIMQEVLPYIKKVASDWIRVCMADGKAE